MISLEHVSEQRQHHVFRLAFEACSARLLLPYPKVTGLQFTTVGGDSIGTWVTRLIVSAPEDEFVMTPDARIAFDLRAYINVEPNHEVKADCERLWTIQLPTGQLCAQFFYKVEPDRQRYDYLAKSSRFAAITKPWGGSVRSNVVKFNVP